MSNRYHVFTIKREYELKNFLIKIGTEYQSSTDSTFTKVYGKTAIIELAVFIEESVELLCEKVTKYVEKENESLFETYRKDNYKQPLKYKKIIQRLLPVYGIRHIANIERDIGGANIDILKNELGKINYWRQNVTHSNVTVPASPDMVLRSFNEILPILRRIELVLRK
jgi:hypothetical protein